MKINGKDTIKILTRDAMIAGLYVVLTLLNPIAFGIVQFRVSEMLCLLPFYDKKYIRPILIGVLISNSFSPLGVIDVVFGLICQVSAYLIFYKFKMKRRIYPFWYAVVCAVIIGCELNIVFNSPFYINFISLFISQLIISCIGKNIIEHTQIKEIL